MNLIDIAQAFSTEDKCLEYLEHMRWPDGVRCPSCGATKISRIERQSRSKNRRNRFYQCLEPSCRQQFSATAGTIFHDSHLPLQKWFMAIALMLNAKKGLSALQLQRDLKVNYRTAWYLNHRIREVMVEDENGPKLTGIVEIDETYIGGKVKGKGVQAGRDNKDIVIGMVQRGGPLRLIHVPHTRAKLMRFLVHEHVDAEKVNRVMTDESMIYPFAFKDTYIEGKRDTIKHKDRKYVNGIIHTNTIESAFSLLKRGIIGSFHKVSIRHLQRYLNEFSYRFNRRNDNDAFEQTVARLAGFKPLPYNKLIAKASEPSDAAAFWWSHPCVLSGAASAAFRAQHRICPSQPSCFPQNVFPMKPNADRLPAFLLGPI